MGSFGDRLQREREMRGITLEEIAEATKIGTRSLRALEEQDFDKLPGGIFNKGFVRAYARYLGLDEEQAVADYLTALSEAQAAGKTTRQEPGANAVAPDRDIFLPDVEDSEPMRLPLGPIAVVVVVAVLLFSGWRYYTRNGLPKLRHVRAAAQQPSPPAAKPAASTDASRPGTNPLPAKDGFVVRVKAKEDSWISIVADGKPVISAVLPKDSEKSVHAQESVVLKLGKATGFDVFYNDKLLPPLIPDGKVKTMEFTSAGLRP
ncbi:MAG: helix-turn-helix domain-containing protein [Acidobacteriia bacterium]|nr:helix-turn-helix domain-containing protein [Terriglobia bacterium]